MGEKEKERIWGRRTEQTKTFEDLYALCLRMSVRMVSLWFLFVSNVSPYLLCICYFAGDWRMQKRTRKKKAKKRAMWGELWRIQYIYFYTRFKRSLYAAASMWCTRCRNVDWVKGKARLANSKLNTGGGGVKHLKEKKHNERWRCFIYIIVFIALVFPFDVLPSTILLLLPRKLYSLYTQYIRATLRACLCVCVCLRLCQSIVWLGAFNF